MASAQRPYLTYSLLVVLSAVFALELAFGVAPPAKTLTPAIQTLIAMGGLNKNLVFDGEWFRLVSAIFLHADPAHLIGNAVVFFFAGRALERMTGWAALLIVFGLSGLGGSLGSLAWNGQIAVAAGASGAILGVLAAALICTRRMPAGRARRNARIWLVLVLVLALVPDPTASRLTIVDLGAHAGGALSGMLAGIWIVAIWPKDSAAPPRAIAWGAVACLALFGGSAIWTAGHYRTEMHLYSAEAYFINKDYNRAAGQYSVAILRNSQNAPAYFGRALSFQQEGQVQNAIADFLKAIELTPEDYRMHLALGGLYSDLGDQARANGYIAEAIRLQPHSHLAYILRGIMKHRLGRSGEAIADFDKATELSPKEADSYNSRAFTYLAMGRPAEALADIRTALALSPADPAILDTEGHIFLALGRPRDAIRSFDAVLEAPNGKQYAASFFGRGMAYEELAIKTLAVRDYKSALNIKAWDIEEKEAQQKARERLQALTALPAAAN
ncbi:MAG: rhomboid family intramembrane serine protease [Rhodomicrobium sp.]